jgi:hypothetical protein
LKASGGIVGIAVLFLATAAYLLGSGLLMLIRPGLISIAAGADILGGLELAGPYMFLLAAAVAALIGWGVLRLKNWARRAAMVVAALGVFLLVPAVSSAEVGFQWGSLAWGGLGVIVRVIVIWYLWQEPVRESFEGRFSTDRQGFPRI